MKTDKLAPGSMIAWAFYDTPGLSIEFLRACMETAPTWPQAWTRQEGADYASAYLAGA